jgi:hypothetical protein
VRWKATQRNASSRPRLPALPFVVLFQSAPAGLLGAPLRCLIIPLLFWHRIFWARTQFCLVLAILTRWNGPER